MTPHLTLSKSWSPSSNLCMIYNCLCLCSFIAILNFRRHVYLKIKLRGRANCRSMKEVKVLVSTYIFSNPLPGFTVSNLTCVLPDLCVYIYICGIYIIWINSSFIFHNWKFLYIQMSAFFQYPSLPVNITLYLILLMVV